MEKQNGIQERIYPLRPSELVGQPDFLTVIEPLVLDEEERKGLADFEQPLFEEAQRLKGISASTHVIYPGAFTDEEGSRIFAEIYLVREVENGETFSEQEIIEGFFATGRYPFSKRSVYHC